MPRLHRARYLTCFYCGRKTSTQYDPRVRHFDCPNCDATNYLDENGEITDPPVATENEATPRKYAVPRAISPPSSPSGAIFCATCLKNQHLLSSVLAQYLPEPDDPDYAERERDLYRFRKQQEKLYPQICADCEPRVRERLEQAAYTAKTDVLRRMIDRTATTGKVMKQRSALDVFDVLGGWLWTFGLVLQLAWHVSVLHMLLMSYFTDIDADQTLTTFRLLKLCGPLLSLLPSADRLISWSFITSLVSVWWNPRFVQIFRGFTKHISGVSRWYAYQFMAIVLRFFVPKVSDIVVPQPALLNMQLAGHVFAAAFAVLLHILGPRSIRIDMTPLFRPSSKTPKFEDLPKHSTSSSSRPDETKSMSELLDEISRSPPRPASPPSPTQQEDQHFLPRPFGGGGQSSKAMTLHRRRDEDEEDDSEFNQLDSLHLSNNHPPAQIHYEQEMDWSPTQSKHRAFNTYGQRQTQGFGQAPTELHKGPFWYRVPPAPTTPAQRVFNPPNQPRLRKSPATNGQGVQFRAGGELGSTLIDRTSNTRHQRGEVDKPQVAFAEPSFFPPAPQNDPRNSLANMFGESLALTEEEKQQQQAQGGWLTRGWFGSGSGADNTGKRKNI
ncbi:Ima1 N-terminal domain-containing protein [Apodospora peruviana]|uniref:Ima1 N-terminal domain-containing protein n=1 Tax=Apodospora peruviana TaxID=516989 RepID=A0AAE0HY37_9PEZI|nr:Ima1 N-terminal domain-containing protein [Apodospora peruviana]